MIKSEGPVTLSGPDWVESLGFRSMAATEELGIPFRYEIEVLSDDPALKASDVLGKTMTVHMALGDDSQRHFNGYVTDFATAGTTDTYVIYRLTLRPWLWLLSRTTNCRIFQNLSVPQILKKIFRDHNFTDIEDALGNSYPTCEYTVQYRETDLNFVTRLMEQEGIYFFFRHEDSKHVLILADSYGSHRPTPGFEKIPFFPPDGQRRMHLDHIERWGVASQIQPGAYTLADFNFTRPQSAIVASSHAPNGHAMAEFEMYDYPGEYETSGDADGYARIRLEELNASYERASGEGNSRGIAVGSLFKLTDHPRDDFNREYLIVSARYQIRTHDFRAGSSSGDEEYFDCSLTAIDSSRPFRPARRAMKPVVRGPQTAIVVGKGGEEIWTDSHGRVKVKFHWDRADGADETSSCWVRVAQIWAGTNWGGIHIPRIGQEVIVDFLEGDPDRPIITGRVYNAANPPPYGLPGSQTQSGIKSRSTKGGDASNANELRFEDKKGSEQLYVQAEKDMDTVIKHDETRLVGHDQTIEVDHDREKTVKNDETVTVQGNRTETVGKNESITISGTRSETVGSVETISIGAARSTTVGAADMLTVGAAQSVAVGAARSIAVAGSETVAVGGSRTVDIVKNDSISVGGKRSAQIGKDEDVSIQGKRTQSIGKDDALQVKEKLELNAGEEIVIKTGDASITMKKNGEITIKGKNITVDGSGKVNVKASSDVIVKGSKVSMN